jgi:hypothetical protein
VWQTHGGAPNIYVAIPAALHATAGQPVYVQVQYYDGGFGRLSYQYDSVSNAYSSPEVTAHSSLRNQSTFETAYFQMKAPSLQHRESGMDFRISSSLPTTSIAGVAVSLVPFPDTIFDLALTQPWLTPVTTRQPGSDPSTLDGHVMAGYQGWFNCPNDVTDGGWVHWTNNGSFTAQNLSVSMWPDTSAYPKTSLCPADNLKLGDGSQAYVFSSQDPAVVDQHFAWMQQYNIDGVWLQRNLDNGQLNNPPQNRYPYFLAEVRKSAAAHGRTWGIMFSAGSVSDATAEQIIEGDWKWLHDVAKVTQDASYQRENGKPAIILWGYSINPASVNSPTVGDRIVDWLKNDPVYGGNYVISGVSNAWPGMLSTWQEHYSHYNEMCVWQTHNFAQDLAAFGPTSPLHEDYMADIYPGLGASPNVRRGGQSYWDEWYNTTAAYNAVPSAKRSVFVGMFDEYDEATAIMPASDNIPLNTTRALVTNGGLPSTWWLRLSLDGKAMMNGQTPITDTLPPVMP